MKIAIYIRVSKRDMHPENQKIKLVEYAEKNDWEYEVFEEKESTRKTRPVKEEVLRRLRSKEFDGLLILKLDRWARSLPELSMEIKELADRGITFISLKDSIDLSTATGRLQFHIICAFAEFERDLIRERTLDGLDRARRQGKKLGRPAKLKYEKIIEGLNQGKTKSQIAKEFGVKASALSYHLKRGPVKKEEI